MSVNVGDRKQSSVEFDNNYFKVHHDAVMLTECHFGAKGEMYENKKYYITLMEHKILNAVSDMGTYIRMANSIYPKYLSELEERRLLQEKAIGMGYDILTKYEIIMRELKTPDDKYTDEIKRLIHEINCLKKWRTSDNKRFGNLG